MDSARDIDGYRKYWAARFGTAPFLPMSRAEMERSAGTAATSSSSPAMPTSITRASAWPSSAGCSRRRAFASASSRSRTGTAPSRSRALGRAATCSSASPPATWTRWSTATPPTGACAATTPTRRAARAASGPDRSVIVYAQRAREAFKDVPIVIGGIEASLRRIAHFDYWSEKVRRSVLLDAKADLLVYGNAERQICEIAHRLAAGEKIGDITDLRGTAFVAASHACGLDRDRLDASRYARAAEPAGRSVCDGAATIRTANEQRRLCECCAACAGDEKVVHFARRVKNADRERSVIRMPALRAGGGRSGAVRARLAHPASGVQSRQRARAGAAPRRLSTCGSIRRRSR